MTGMQDLTEEIGETQMEKLDQMDTMGNQELAVQTLNNTDDNAHPLVHQKHRTEQEAT